MTMARAEHSSSRPSAKRSASKSLVITKELVKTAAVTGERYTLRDAKCAGLMLRVGASGKKSWAFDYRDPNGHRQTFTIGPADRIDPGEARDEARTLGRDPAGEKRRKRIARSASAARTVRAFLDGRYWTDYLAHRRSGKATQDRVKSAWEPFLDRDMSTLDPDATARHRAARLTAGVKPQTLNRDRTALLGLLNRAVDCKVLDHNPLKVAVFKPLETEDEDRVRWLGQRDEHEDLKDKPGKKIGERERFNAALAQRSTPDYLRRMATIVLNTGLRRRELFELRWPNVSQQRKLLTVTAATAKKAKTRHIDLNTDALAVLAELSKVRHVSGYLFINPDTSKPFTTIKRAWTTLIEQAQLEDFQFRDIRHDFASRLVQAGVDLYVVKELLGHSSIKQTEKYAHLAPAQKRAAVATLVAA